MTVERASSPSIIETRAVEPDVSYLLSALRESMVEAREAVMAARRPPAGPTQLKDARAEYLVAVLAFHRALSVLCLPIPHGLRDEVRLLRGLFPGTDIQG